MNYNTIKYFCTANGEGVRTAIFVSGCRLHCKGCFNSVAWDFNSGKELTDEKIDEILESIEPSYCDGLSILGGEPMDDNNAAGVLHIIDKFREKFGNDKNIWLWTGYYVNTIEDDIIKHEALYSCDYIVDGPFDSDKYDINLMYRGSYNQHIYHVENGKMTDVSDSFKKVD